MTHSDFTERERCWFARKIGSGRDSRRRPKGNCRGISRARASEALVARGCGLFLRPSGRGFCGFDCCSGMSSGKRQMWRSSGRCRAASIPRRLRQV